MDKGRLLAFSDGVFAIILTIMVLELTVPHGTTWADLHPFWPAFLVYAFSYLYVGIYWVNHHHFYHLVTHVTGGILWANLHLMFWLALIPFTTAWLGVNYAAHAPTAFFGWAILMPAIAWTIMLRVCLRAMGPNSKLAQAMGRDVKGNLSLVLYGLGIASAYWRPWLADVFYFAVALLWLVPDRRVERVLG